MFGRLGLILIFLVISILGFTIFDKIDRAVDYTIVDAQVITVKEKCYLQKRERGLFTETIMTTAQKPCDDMEHIWAYHPAYAGYDLHRDYMVKLEYRSPADEMTHVIERKLAESRAKSLHSYDHLQILAHKKNPERIKWL